MKNLLAALFVATLLQAHAQSDLATGASLPSTGNAIEKLDKDIPKLMKEADVPGMSVAVIRGGKLAWHHHYGVANASTKEAVNDETIFEAASLSKVVTAYTFLKLMDAGKINLDTPLNKYLGNNYDVPDDARINLVTARRVLSHSAGFPNWRPGGSRTLPIMFQPGEKFSYSGEGFVYLSKVMEKVTGKPFEDLVRELVFEPLQMSHSSFLWREQYKKLQVYRHDWLGNVSGQPNDPGPNAAASLHTTVTDYAKFLIAVLNGTGLRKNTVQEMFTPQIKLTDQPELAWGLGIGLELTPGGKYCWHWGDQGDSKCYVTADITGKNALLWFTNSANGLAPVRELLADGLGGTHAAPDWLNYDRINPYVRSFAKSVIDNGAEQALAQYRAQRSTTGGQTIGENTFNSFGYQLLRMKKVDDAIAIFKQNTDDFPQSSNTWDSLGEAYMIKGDKESAIRNYEKSLQLDPGNVNAAEQVKKLKAGS